MSPFSSVTEIKNNLHQAMSSLDRFATCAVLDYPENEDNIGTHLLWLSAVFYVTDVIKANIGYSASVGNFCASEMESRIG